MSAIMYPSEMLEKKKMYTPWTVLAYGVFIMRQEGDTHEMMND